ncbi:ATPase [candidate division SR1 bacterium]|nr:ATPase [candidate division SR1 bacterium]
MEKYYLLLKESLEATLPLISSDFQRDVFMQIDRDSRLIGLIGERGVGKTTMMLQKIQEKGSGFYFSADNPIIKDTGLYLFAHYLYFELNLREIYIDEVHKYPGWTDEIKSIYDSLPEMKVVFSGSSSLDLFKGVLDLVRRTDFYIIHPMNYAEYLRFFHNIQIPNFTLDEIIKNHKKIALEYGLRHKETLFKDFLHKGQYPYTKNSSVNFVFKFQSLFDKTIFEDLPIFLNLQATSLDKLKRLLYFIANSTPSELSFSNLAQKIGIDKSVVENTLTLLAKIGIISLVPKFGNLSYRVRKEYKIFLGNTCLYNAYNLNIDIGILRECFVASQLKRIKNAELFSPKQGDIIVQIIDKIGHFEVGGKSKKEENYDNQIFVVKDGITVSDNKRVIPMWLFGLLKV